MDCRMHRSVFAVAVPDASTEVESAISTLLAPHFKREDDFAVEVWQARESTQVRLWGYSRPSVHLTDAVLSDIGFTVGVGAEFDDNKGVWLTVEANRDSIVVSVPKRCAALAQHIFETYEFAWYITPNDPIRTVFNSYAEDYTFIFTSFDDPTYGADVIPF